MPRSYNSPAMHDLRTSIAAAKARIDSPPDTPVDSSRGLGALANDAIEQAKSKEGKHELLKAKVQTMAEQVYGGIVNPLERQSAIIKFVADFEITTNDDGEDVIYYNNKLGRVIVLSLNLLNIVGPLKIPIELQIDELLINDNEISDLQELPSELKTLCCSNNQLTNLPKLPEGLTVLDCGGNKLTDLPKLPDRLTDLMCYGNQLTSLPDLPDGIISLYCTDNKLTSLPELPSGLRALSCGYNQLTNLPKLPMVLKTLVCDNNKLTNLLELPGTLSILHSIGNPLSQETLDMIKSRGF